MHTATLGMRFKQAVVGGGESRDRRQQPDALSDRPLKHAKDLHVGSEFLWTRTHR